MSDSVRPHRRQPTRLPSLGFSRQEHWSGLPFPSPIHESESESEVVSDSWQPHGFQPTRLLRPWDFPSKSTGVGCHYLLRISTKNAPNLPCQKAANTYFDIDHATLFRMFQILLSQNKSQRLYKGLQST